MSKRQIKNAPVFKTPTQNWLIPVLWTAQGGW
jgi:hypothetical protein